MEYPAETRSFTWFIWYVILSYQFWHASTRDIIVASLALMTAWEVNGFPKTWRCVDHLIERVIMAKFNSLWSTYFRDSSTTRRCAAIEVPQTIHRSWLKLERMTDMPAPTLPSVLEIGTRTYFVGQSKICRAFNEWMHTLSNVTNAVPATDEYAVLICFVSTPGPLGMRITVNPVFGRVLSKYAVRSHMNHCTSVLHPVVK